jgi:cystathionine beta-lyase/cystathionine gamma-synthase
MTKKSGFGFSTRSISDDIKNLSAYDPVVPDMVLSTTFRAEAGASFSIEGQQDEIPFFYTRWGNPTIRKLETKLARLESAGACVAFGSGMAAVAALMLYELKPGDRLVISDVCYAAVSEVTNDLFPAWISTL